MDLETRINLYKEAEAAYMPELNLEDRLKELNFFSAPASTKYHGAYDGGLFDHSYAVFKSLKTMTENLSLPWKNEQSVFVVGMFHDLCKCDQYVKTDGARIPGSETMVYGNGMYHYEYNDKTLLKGHGAKSVMVLSQFMQLTEEEILCIRYHMGAYEKDDWEGFDLAIRKYPTVLYTHTADMEASKIIGA